MRKRKKVGKREEKTKGEEEKETKRRKRGEYGEKMSWEDARRCNQS